MKTLIVMIVVAVAGYVGLRWMVDSEADKDRAMELKYEENRALDSWRLNRAAGGSSPQEKVSAPAEPPQAVVIPDPVTTSDERLVLIRGEVVRREAGGIEIVECREDPVSRSQGFAQLVDAQTGAGGIAQLAQLAVDTDRKAVEREFGVLVIPRGVRERNGANFSRAAGTVALYGRDGKNGTDGRVNVIAADLDMDVGGVPLCSTRFALGATAAPPPRSIYPEGVDTPEERRAFLESIKGQSVRRVPESNVRTRGY